VEERTDRQFATTDAGLLYQKKQQQPTQQERVMQNKRDGHFEMMNRFQPLTRSIATGATPRRLPSKVAAAAATTTTTNFTAATAPAGACDRRCFGGTALRGLPMKPGTELKPLAVCKGQDPPRVLDRSEYPPWLNSLATPLPSLAVLRKIPNEDADEVQIQRYLKLTRRLSIRRRNEESTA
jgi:hypothetical protein